MNDRTQWRDSDWAAYLGCSVAQVAEYRGVLADIFVTCIAQSVSTGKYRFEMHKYDIAPSGHKRLFLMLSSNNTFNTYDEALKDANTNIIPKLTLTDFWAKMYEVPAKSLQLMLIKQK